MERVVVEHWHCPDGHDHPCPIETDKVFAASPFGFECFCDHCYHRHGEIVPMVACTPDICAERVALEAFAPNECKAGHHEFSNGRCKHCDTKTAE